METKDLSKEQIVQKLANAHKTYALCGGHYKAGMNQSAIEKFKKILSDMGEEIPNDDYLYSVGKFNGDGSY